MPSISKRMSSIKQSPIVAMNNKAKAMTADGVDVINFSIGVPGFLPPKRIYDAAREALEHDSGAYLHSRGSDTLVNAFLGRLKKDGFDYSANEVTCAVGAKNALNNLFIALLDEGDEVIYPSPFWSSYEDNISMYGGVNIAVACPATQDYKMTGAQLENAITNRTKIFLFNNPSNPTGMVYSKEEIKALGDVLVKHPDIWIISDDLYDKMIFDGEEFHHLLHTHPELKERMIIVQSVSKTYGMPGWRVGMIAAQKLLIDTLLTITANTFMNIPAVTQAAAAEAFAGDHEFVREKCVEFQEKRDIVMSAINEIEGLICPFPRGAFYAFPHIGNFIGKSFKGEKIASDIQFCELLLEHAHIACVPGSAFGDKTAFRLSYAMDNERLTEGLRRLKSFISEIS